MKFDRQKGIQARLLRQVLHRTCRYCRAPFDTQDPQQERCHQVACRRASQREQSRRYRASIQVAAARRGNCAAPDLAEQCAQLEAQLTPANRPQWPQIIAGFTTPRVAGYRDLAQLTRACVHAKLKLEAGW